MRLMGKGQGLPASPGRFVWSKNSTRNRNRKNDSLPKFKGYGNKLGLYEDNWVSYPVNIQDKLFMADFEKIIFQAKNSDSYCFRPTSLFLNLPPGMSLPVIYWPAWRRKTDPPSYHFLKLPCGNNFFLSNTLSPVSAALLDLHAGAGKWFTGMGGCFAIRANCLIIQTFSSMRRRSLK